MPPQMGSNHGACDMMPQRTARRALVASVACTSKRAATKPAGAAPKAAADKPKRPSRARKAVPVQAPVGGFSPPASTSKEDGDHGAAAAAVRSKLVAMHARFRGELSFLVTEFTKMEVQLSLEVGVATPHFSGGAEESGPQQQLNRLRFFIEHVKRTVDRMEQAKTGAHHYTSQQLDMLEEHITQRLLPVKARMLAQLAMQQQQQQPSSAPSPGSKSATSAALSPAPSSGGSLFLGGFSGKDDATAVSDGWVVGTPTPAPPPPALRLSDASAAGGGGDSGNGGGGGGGRLVASLSSSGHLSGTTSSASLPRACSSLSFAELGDLCGDQEGADDCCGGVFLVGGDDCDDVNGSGIGLDLYDLGQGKESFLSLGREQRYGRWPSISTLSSASATTDGELSDDSVSVDADSTPCGSSAFPRSGGCESVSSSPARTAAATAAAVKTEAGARAGGAGGSTAGAGAGAGAGAAAKGAAGQSGGGSRLAAAAAAAAAATPSAVKTGIDQEMGELSELFAPDAFLQSTVLDTEMEAAGSGGARAAASAMDMAIEPTATEPARPPPTASASSAAAPAGTKAAAPVLAAAAAAGAAAAAPAVKAEYLPASAAVVSPPVPLAPATTTGGSARSAAAAAAAAARPAVAPKQECRCGEAACPSLVSAARKRPLLELSSSTAGSGTSGAAPLSLMAGMPYAGLSSRQRKRQRSLAPVLSAPRTVSYECALCKESYPSEISSNPWWSLFLHECPRCHRMQVPRVDAASAAVSVDYIHAVCAEEGEGCDSDGYGSDSGSDSDDDGPDDGREGIAAFDTDIIAGDAQAGCKEARLSTLQASRLLVLMSHARTCPGRHANPQHADVCRSTKFLMLHMRDCNGHGPNGEPCEHRWCRPCKSLLSHLVRCPIPSTCRICTPLDLPGPLRQLRELNVAQARHAAATAAAASSAAAAAVVARAVAGTAGATLAPAPAPTAAGPGTVVDARCTAVVKAETVSVSPRPAAAAPTSLQQQLQQPQ